MPWWSFIVGVIFGVPILIGFVFFVESVDDGAWQAASWAQYYQRESALFDLQADYFMLYAAKAYRMPLEENAELQVDLHRRLAIDDVSIEIEVLCELRALRDAEREQ